MKVLETVDIEKQKNDNEEKEYRISSFITKVNLSENQIKVLRDEFFGEYDAICKEREEAKLEEKWDSLDAQYKGEIEEDEDRQYNLHKHTTKIKVDAISRSILQAINETDPLFSISPRSEYGKTIGYDVCQKQEDFLDHAIDERIPLKAVKDLVTHSATLKGTGIQKNIYDIRVVRRKKQEIYKGDPKPIYDDSGVLVGTENKGLDAFMLAHGEDIQENPDKYVGYIKDLQEGKKITLMVEYDSYEYDEPLPKFYNLKDFFVRLKTKGYEGLADSKGVFCRDEFSFWELKREEKRGVLENIDGLKKEYGLDGNNEWTEKGDLDEYNLKDFKILEAEFYFKVSEGGEEEKLLVWFEEENKVFLGAVYFPWIGLDTQYNPHYVKIKEEGFYQPGVGEDLTDSNIAENVLLNFYLEAIHTANTVTPILEEGSRTEEQFQNKEWAHGVPLVVDKGRAGQIRFVNEFMRPVDSMGMISGMQMISRDQDDVSGVSQLTTGRESNLDPTAPASKTIALLNQSGVNVKHYIEKISPSWNRDATMFLQLYAQMNEDGRSYRKGKSRSKAITGEQDLFGSITREEMLAKTNIQSRAMSFDFDKLNQKKEDLALYQILGNEVLVRSDPEQWGFVVRTLVKSWSPKWKNVIDKILPTTQEIQQKKSMLAIQAIDQYMRLIQDQAQTTGQQPQVDFNALQQLINQAVASMSIPQKEGAK